MQLPSRPVLLLVHLVVYGALLARFAPGSGWAALAIAGLLIWISLVDLHRFEIPDSAAFLLVGVALWLAMAEPRHEMILRMAGGVIWPLFFWVTGWAYRRLRGVDGLGFGDVKLMVGIGLLLGFLDAIQAVLAAALSGILVLSLFLVVRSGPRDGIGQQAVAFGPFLCLSAWYLWVRSQGA